MRGPLRTNPLSAKDIHFFREDDDEISGGQVVVLTDRLVRTASARSRFRSSQCTANTRGRFGLVQPTRRGATSQVGITAVLGEYLLPRLFRAAWWDCRESIFGWLWLVESGFGPLTLQCRIAYASINTRETSRLTESR